MARLTQIRRRKPAPTNSAAIAVTEYLGTASVSALQSFELSRLNSAANLKKQIGGLIDELTNEQSAALLARFLIQNRTKGTRP